jgi:hypothetical protein
MVASRYGAEDQIGSLNEITPAHIVAAARLVRQGRVFDLGRILDSSVPQFPGRFWQQTPGANAHLNNPRRPRGTDAGSRRWAVSSAAESLARPIAGWPGQMPGSTRPTRRRARVLADLWPPAGCVAAWQAMVPSRATGRVGGQARTAVAEWGG